MNELVGKDCCVIFSDKHTDWPFPGYPAWVTVLAVDMPMVKLAPRHSGGYGAKWINAARIAEIEAMRDVE